MTNKTAQLSPVPLMLGECKRANTRLTSGEDPRAQNTFSPPSQLDHTWSVCICFLFFKTHFEGRLSNNTSSLLYTFIHYISVLSSLLSQCLSLSVRVIKHTITVRPCIGTHIKEPRLKASVARSATGMKSCRSRLGARGWNHPPT